MDPVSLLSITLAANALACGPLLVAQIKESSPDLVTIENRSAEGWSVSELSFDFTRSNGRIFVDSSPQDDGVSGYMPFISAKGRIKLKAVQGASDGSRQMKLEFDAFPTAETYHFLIDFDAGLSSSDLGQAYIEPEEVAGTTLTATFTHESGQTSTTSGAFTADGNVMLGGGGCV